MATIYLHYYSEWTTQVVFSVFGIHTLWFHDHFWSCLLVLYVYISVEYISRWIGYADILVDTSKQFLKWFIKLHSHQCWGSKCFISSQHFFTRSLFLFVFKLFGLRIGYGILIGFNLHFLDHQWDWTSFNSYWPCWCFEVLDQIFCHFFYFVMHLPHIDL